MHFEAKPTELIRNLRTSHHLLAFRPQHFPLAAIFSTFTLVDDFVHSNRYLLIVASFIFFKAETIRLDKLILNLESTISDLHYAENQATLMPPYSFPESPQTIHSLLTLVYTFIQYDLSQLISCPSPFVRKNYSMRYSLVRWARCYQHFLLLPIPIPPNWPF